MGQGDSASVLTRAKVRKMREYWMYFPFFMLHDWGQKIRQSPQLPLCGVALIQEAFFSKLLLDKIQQLLRWSGDGVVVAVIGQNLQGVIF